MQERWGEAARFGFKSAHNGTINDPCRGSGAVVRRGKNAFVGARNAAGADAREATFHVTFQETPTRASWRALC